VAAAQQFLATELALGAQKSKFPCKIAATLKIAMKQRIFSKWCLMD
jgi:hypothetical protein